MLRNVSPIASLFENQSFAIHRSTVEVNWIKQLTFPRIHIYMAMYALPRKKASNTPETKILQGISMSLLCLLSACGTTGTAPLQQVSDVNLERYMGVWYEIASYPNRFQKGCSCTQATYSLTPSGEVRVENICTKKGKVVRTKGNAKVVANTGNAQLKVSFFWPFYGDYHIIMLDSEYQWAVVGHPSRKYLWVLSREKSLPVSVWETVARQLPTNGYSEEKLMWTDHKTCKP
jgi:apolipoprotein D and lipocalin family protein